MSQAGSTPQVEDKFGDLSLPSIEEMSVQLEQLVQQGSLSPEQARAMLQERSQMEDVRSDGVSKQAQYDALSQLQDINSSGGLRNQDKYALSQIANQEAANERGSREAILQSAQQRGAGGGGLEMLSQMKNQQDSATRASNRDMGVATVAQERALQSLMAQGQMGGQINQQDFSQQAQKAQAADQVARFNAANSQQVNLTNTAANNQAQASNLSAKQGVSDANVNLRNQQQQYNKNLNQTNFNNEMSKRSRHQDVENMNSQIQGQNSQNQANANNQMLSTGLQTAAAVYTGGASLAATQAAEAARKKQNGET